MSIRFGCPTCKSTLEASDRKAGTKVFCPKCQQKLLIPRPQTRTILAPLLPQYATTPASSQHSPATVLPLEAIVKEEPPAGRQVNGRQQWRHPFVWLRRCCSPSMLLLSFCLLPLPFIEVRCNEPANATVATQSGLQILYGGCSTPSLANQAAIELKAKGNLDPDIMAIMEKEHKNTKPFPSVFIATTLPLFFLAVLLSLVWPLGFVRILAVGACISAAVALIFLQMALGFPLEKRITQELIENSKSTNQNMVSKINPPNDMQRGQEIARLEEKLGQSRAMLAASLLHVHYTPWFYAWLVLIIASLVPLAIEGMTLVVSLAAKLQSSRPSAFAAE